jgi:hypothetical protein
MDKAAKARKEFNEKLSARKKAVEAKGSKPEEEAQDCCQN